MGLGLMVGQNQRVDQGTINAILKILSYGVNPIYLRDRNDNAPTQTSRTGFGKILAVTDTEKSYRLLESPKVLTLTLTPPNPPPQTTLLQHLPDPPNARPRLRRSPTLPTLSHPHHETISAHPSPPHTHLP